MGARPFDLKPLTREAMSVVQSHYEHGAWLSSPALHDRLGGVRAASKPTWLVPHANRDLAAALAFRMAMRSEGRVGYLALGESACSALVRIWLLAAGVDRSQLELGSLPGQAFILLVRVMVKISKSPLVILDRDVPKKRIRKTTQTLIADYELKSLVVDDPDVRELRSEATTPEMDRWRVRMEFREAVRGTNVCLMLPGKC